MEKPDFNQIAASIYYKNHELDTDTILIIAMDHVWNTHVLPLHEELKSTVDEKWEVISDSDKTIKQLQAENKLLQEEIESLREQLLEEGERD